MISKRPVVSFCIMMICGILAAFVSDSPILVASLAFLMLCTFYATGSLRKGSWFVPVGMIVFFLAGSLEFLAADYLQTSGFKPFEGQNVVICGSVASEPEVKEERVTYTIQVQSIRRGKDGERAGMGGKLLLSTIKNTGRGFFDYGRELTFEGELTLPRGVRNPGGFDYRRYLAQKGVGALMFAYPYAIEAGGRQGNFLVEAGLSIRKKIITVIEKSLPRQQAGLLNGMLIGYREGLSEDVQDAFSNAGLTHIMAVSGANVAFLLLPLACLFKLLRFRRTPANLVMIAFLIFFIFITGFEPSVLRAVLMAVILLISAILYREPDTYTSIALSCILLLAVNPCMLFNAGFQLSYAATLSIVMLYKNINKLVSRPFIPALVTETFSATMAAQLGVLPITLVCFNKVSLIAILSNLLAVPMLEIITILGTLMAVLGQISLVLSQMLGYLNALLLSAVLYIVKFSASVPLAVLKTVTPPVLLAAAYYICVWFLLWYKPLKNIKLKPRHAAAPICLTAVMLLGGFLQPKNLEVSFLDVGEGDSAFIRTCTNQNVLIDGGGSANPQYSSRVGETVVIPFLLDSGVSHLDAVIATHPHSDHTQGLENVIREMKVKRLIVPSISGDSGFDSLLHLAGERGIPILRCGSGDRIQLDERTSFLVLSPDPGGKVDQDSFNNTSLVLKLSYGQTDILFTGDAEQEIEEKLVSGNGKEQLAADIIKIAHHGSTTSTGRSFLDAVKPKAAIVSVGRNNFGHPSPVTLKLLEQCGIRCYRTDECGAIRLKSDGHTVKIKRTVAK